MRRLTLTALALAITTVGLAATAAPARANHYLDRLRERYLADRQELDTRYQRNLTRINNRYTRDLANLNEELAAARIGTRGAQRIYVEQAFHQRRQVLRIEFERRRDELQNRWNAQRGRLRSEYLLARERHESLHIPPVVVAPPVYEHHGHEHRPAPPAGGYLQRVLGVLY
jgi:hypothetical protein